MTGCMRGAEFFRLVGRSLRTGRATTNFNGLLAARRGKGWRRERSSGRGRTVRQDTRDGEREFGPTAPWITNRVICGG